MREITLIKHDYRVSNNGASKGLTSQAIHKFMWHGIALCVVKLSLPSWLRGWSLHPPPFVLGAGTSSRLLACASRSIFASLIITCLHLLPCLKLINSSGTQAIIKWQSYDSSHHAVPRLAGRTKYLHHIASHTILHHIASHTNTLQILKAIPHHMHTLQKQVRSPSRRVVANFIVVVKQVYMQTFWTLDKTNTILHCC